MCSLCFADGRCVPVDAARKFRVDEWGYLNASTVGSRTVDATRIAEMKAEIYKRGPIVCSMQTEDDGADKPSGPWHCYEGGVYKTPHTYNTTNHVINLLGWGVEEDTGTPYWVGRHSGGTIFGEEGFFRIEAGVNALNIESHCGWATVQDAAPKRGPLVDLPCENGVPRPNSSSMSTKSAKKSTPPVLTNATMLRGIDVSHYQGTVDWAKVASVPGMTFACAKASEGTTYVDEQFKANWGGMKSAGLFRCAYHFARPGSNATAQAMFFVNTVNGAGGFAAGTKSLQLMLDLEQTDGQSQAAVWAWTQEFVATLKRLTGRPAIMYTGHYFWTGSVGDPDDNLNCPLVRSVSSSSSCCCCCYYTRSCVHTSTLCIAAPSFVSPTDTSTPLTPRAPSLSPPPQWIPSYNGATLPTIPKAWLSSGYTFWQYGTNGAAAPGGKAAAIPGISGSSVDVDVFKFSVATLKKFCF